MKYILYCEDDVIINKTKTSILKKSFPKFSIRSAYSLEEALGSVKDDIKDLKLVITDGDLNDGMGWDLAEKLKEKDYKGSVIYWGNKKIPPEKKSLFDYIAAKLDDFSLINIAKQYLE